MVLEMIKDISSPSLQCNPFRIVGGTFVCGCAAGVDTGGTDKGVGEVEDGRREVRS